MVTGLWFYGGANAPHKHPIEAGFNGGQTPHRIDPSTPRDVSTKIRKTPRAKICPKLFFDDQTYEILHVASEFDGPRA